MRGHFSETASRHRERWSPGPVVTDLAALATLAGLTLIFFWKITLTNRVLVGLDVFTYFYPYRDFASEALRAGQLPLWNPYLFMGAPLLANSQAAVLYPLHWPFLWLPVPKQVAWSIALHIWLAGAGTYFFGRAAFRLSPPAALVASSIFALGGFLGAQVEHVNQLNASAWLPWLLLCVEVAMRPGRERWTAMLGGGAIVGLVLLAGHTQAAYIVLFGAGVHALLRGWADFRQRRIGRGLRGVVVVAVMSLVGLVLAAGQLLPTLELSRHSVRSGGLPYNEAASFSLKPGLMFKAFLPPLIWEPPFSEFVAYVGLLGLALAAAGTWAVLRRRRAGGEALGLALVGVFLAFGAYNPVYYVLYKVVPGFDLFRAPARWLLFYAFGAALLAGIGLEQLSLWAEERLSRADKPARAIRRAARAWQPAVIAVLLLELFAAGRRLAYNQPTAPTAYDSMRTAPSHLLADQSFGSGIIPFRFLSMSDIRYDPGDMEDLQEMYESSLSQDELYDLIVATKMKEVLAYNLPLRHRLYSVDGYDGGLLPLRNYVTLEGLFLPEEKIWPDGRLRQQLRAIPPVRLLSLLNVKYVLTDKTQDAWIDDIFYDLEHTVPLGEVTLDELPDFETTHLGVVSYLTETTGLENGTPVAEVIVSGSGDRGQAVEQRITLLAGEHTSEGIYQDGLVGHDQARVGHRWRDDARGSDYVTELSLKQPLQPETVTVRSLLPGGRILLRGMSLIDRDSGTSRNLSIDPVLPLVHSGDVKIYENLDVLPRAFVAEERRFVSDDATALELLRDPNFDPSRTVLLASEGKSPADPESLHLFSDGVAPVVELSSSEGAKVEILSYEPHEVHLRTRIAEAGTLVLTDAYYPGWEATVDGMPAPIHRANIAFRAVELAEGEHHVVFRYRQQHAFPGLGLSLAGWLLWGLLMIVLVLATGRKAASSV